MLNECSPLALLPGSTGHGNPSPIQTRETQALLFQPWPGLPETATAKWAVAGGEGFVQNKMVLSFRKCSSQVSERNLPSIPAPRRFLLGRPVLADYGQKRMGHSGLPGHWGEPLGISSSYLSYKLGKSDSKRRAKRRKYECLLCVRHLHSCSVLP